MRKEEVPEALDFSSVPKRFRNPTSEEGKFWKEKAELLKELFESHLEKTTSAPTLNGHVAIANGERSHSSEETQVLDDILNINNNQEIPDLLTNGIYPSLEDFTNGCDLPEDLLNVSLPSPAKTVIIPRRKKKPVKQEKDKDGGGVENSDNSLDLFSSDEDVSVTAVKPAEEAKQSEDVVVVPETDEEVGLPEDKEEEQHNRSDETFLTAKSTPDDKDETVVNAVPADDDNVVKKKPTKKKDPSRDTAVFTSSSDDDDVIKIPTSKMQTDKDKKPSAEDDSTTTVTTKNKKGSASEEYTEPIPDPETTEVIFKTSPAKENEVQSKPKSEDGAAPRNPAKGVGKNIKKYDVKVKPESGASSENEIISATPASQIPVIVQDKEKPSTSKKMRRELEKNKKLLEKKVAEKERLSKGEAAARHGVLSSSEDEGNDDEGKRPPPRFRRRKMKATPSEDEKARMKTSVVVNKLAPEIEAELKKNGFVIIDEDRKQKAIASDSDSDMLKLNKAIKSLVACNKNKSWRVDADGVTYYSPVKVPRAQKPGKKAAKESDDEEMLLLSDKDGSGSDAKSDDDDGPKIGLKSMKELLDPDMLSEMEDLPDVDGESKPKKEDSRSKSEKQDKSKPSERYKTPAVNISDDDDEEGKDKKDVLTGSDSEGDIVSTRKRKSIKSEASGSDSEPLVIKKTRNNRKKMKLDSDSDFEVEEVKTESDAEASKSGEAEHSDDSDFQKTKKKKKANSSDDEKDKKGGQKRRRIKAVKDSDSDESDDSVQEVPVDSQASTPGKKGRKDIRKIMDNSRLQKSTKEAEKEEEERKKRLAEKQKLYNEIYQKNAELQDAAEGGSRLILEFDEEKKIPVIEVDPSIASKLKTHQVSGVQFMHTACFESLEAMKKNTEGGCILAHCMGLGKTLQTIAFTYTAMEYKQYTHVERVLIICPLNTVTNWLKEYKRWLKDVPTSKFPPIHCLYEGKNINERITDLKHWERKGGVGIIHYDSFRLLVSSTISEGKGKKKGKKVNQTHADVINRVLLNPGPDIVVCDEGHLLKNHKSMLSAALARIRTMRRVVLTGTPLQNNLVEYHTMVNFVKPNLLGSLREFTNRFANPIKNGQHADSSERDVKMMKRRSHVLYTKLNGIVQRLDFSILTPYLPPKFEYCILVRLSEKQKALYRDYLENFVPPASDEGFGGDNGRRKQILKHYQAFIRILAHPISLTMKKTSSTNEEETETDGSIKDFIDDDETTTTTSVESDSDIECLDENKKSKSKKKRNTRSTKKDEGDETSNSSAPDLLERKDWWMSHFDKKEDMYDTELSGKLVILQSILRKCEEIGDRLLVFSQYLDTLDIIEEFLGQWDSEAVEKNKDKPKSFPERISASEGRWRRDKEYFRIDGQTKTNDRQKHCDVFNKKGAQASQAKLFLISTKAGGLGINLFGANRVVIFDASWNPSNDMQSIFRVYRFGQDKPCYIYRFVSYATMEEKVYNRQVVKLSLSSRVVDEHQVDRHFKFDDVDSLYAFEPDAKVDRPIPALPKDRLLADLIDERNPLSKWIETYFEHDTLLQNKEEETLTEEEKKIAWEEFKNEGLHRPNLQQNQDSVTFQRIVVKLAAKFPGAELERIHASAQMVLQKLNEMKFLINRFNQDSYRMIPDQQRDILDRIRKIQAWIAESLGVPVEGVALFSGIGINPVAGQQARPHPGILRQNLPVVMQDQAAVSEIQRRLMESINMGRVMSGGVHRGRGPPGITVQNGRLPQLTPMNGTQAAAQQIARAAETLTLD